MKFRGLLRRLCIFSVMLNTCMFPYNLFNEMHDMAVFNLLCAGGCWIGYFKFKGEQTDGN